ncbi:MAG: hypothetical protein R3C29_03005 [Dehalococcoidia bacterium]
MDETRWLVGRHYPDKDQYSRIVLANVSYLDVWRRETAILVNSSRLRWSTVSSRRYTASTGTV